MKSKKILLSLLMLVIVCSIFTFSVSAAEFPLGSQSDSSYYLKEGYYTFDSESSRPLDFSYFDFNSNYEYYFNFPFYVDITIDDVAGAVLYCDSMQVYYSAESNNGYEIYVRIAGISSINSSDDAIYDLLEGYINERLGDYENIYRSTQGFNNHLNTVMGMSGTSTQVFLPSSINAPSNFYYFFVACSFYNQRPYDFLIPGSYEFVIPDNLPSSYAFKFAFTCNGVDYFDTIFIESENNIVKTITYSDSVTGISIPVYRGGFENPDKRFQMHQYQYIKPWYSYTLINNNTPGYVHTLSQFITYKPYYVKPGYDIYNDGYSDGYNSGYDYGYDQGYIVGDEDGYDDGYDVGYEDGQEDSITSGFFLGIINTLDSLSIGPISVFDIIITLLGLFVLGWVLKLIAGG